MFPYQSSNVELINIIQPCSTVGTTRYKHPCVVDGYPTMARPWRWNITRTNEGCPSFGFAIKTITVVEKDGLAILAVAFAFGVVGGFSSKDDQERTSTGESDGCMALTLRGLICRSAAVRCD